MNEHKSVKVVSSPMQAKGRELRECGHPNDWTIGLDRLDGKTENYCLGCLMDKVGLKPVSIVDKRDLVFQEGSELHKID